MQFFVEFGTLNHYQKQTCRKWCHTVKLERIYDVLPIDYALQNFIIIIGASSIKSHGLKVELKQEYNSKTGVQTKTATISKDSCSDGHDYEKTKFVYTSGPHKGNFSHYLYVCKRCGQNFQAK